MRSNKKNINPYELNYNSILIKKIFNLHLMKNRNSYFRDFERLLTVSGGCSFDGMGGGFFSDFMPNLIFFSCRSRNKKHYPQTAQGYKL